MSDKSKVIKTIVLLFISVILLEVFVFNFRFWESLSFKEPGSYTIDIEDRYIAIKDINANVKNIRLFIDAENNNKPVPLQITISDEANTNCVLPVTEIFSPIRESNYIRLYTDGNASEIIIKVTDDYSLSDENTSVALNQVRPFNFRPTRVVDVFIVLLMIIALLPVSPIYKISLLSAKNSIEEKNMVSIIAAVFSLVAFWSLTAILFQGLNIVVYYNWNYVEAIYTFQAEALLDGHAYLNIPAPEFLSQMDNPYDHAARIELSERLGEMFNLDFAYFNGHYYSYYGIIPTLLFYLPFYLITGTPADNSFVIIIFGAIFIIAAFRLIYVLSSILYKEISLGEYIIFSLALVFGSTVYYCAQVPNIYSVAFITALAFAAEGIVFWLKARLRFEENKKGTAAPIGHLIAGSIFIGLAIGCRPTFGILVFLAFPIFAGQIKERLFFSVKGLKNTLAVILPVFLIGCGLLYFNYVRFGSPFDFGATYNLASMDLEKRQPEVRRLWLGMFEYLFQPLNINGTFPYVHSIYDYDLQTTDYMGYLFFDPVFGGFFALSPIALGLIFFKSSRQSLKEKNLYWLSILCIVFALVLLVFDIEMTGITMRYIMDFSFLLMIPASIVLLDQLNSVKKEQSPKFFTTARNAVIFVALLTVGINVFLALADEQMRSMAIYSSKLYYSLKYLIFALR